MTMKIFDLELKESSLTELSENDTSKICGGAAQPLQSNVMAQPSSSQDSALVAQNALAASQANSESNTIAARNAFDQLAQSFGS
jgi:hypothetical protein